MRKGKKLKVLCTLVVVLAMILTTTACESKKSEKKEEETTKTKSEANKNEVSESVYKIIETMMTGPNEELMFTPSVIGEGTQQSEQEIQKIQDQNQTVKEKWKNAVGKYFSEEGLDKFLLSGPALTYLQEAKEQNMPLQAKDVTLEEKSEYTEKVRVKYLIGSQEKEIRLLFLWNTDGNIDTVSAEGVQEYEPEAITKEDFMSAYAKQENLTMEEAKVHLEEQHSFLKTYGIHVEDYNIVYEKRMKDKDVGDGLILTSTIYTEMLVDKESGKYVSYGIAAAVDTQLRGNVEGLSSYDSSSAAHTWQSGNVIVYVLGGAMFQTDGNREFTKKDIQKTVQNSYQYIIDEEIVFTR